MSFTLKIALSWLWDLIIAPFVVIWGHSSVVEHSTADQEVTCFFCLSAKDKWIVFTLHFSEKVMWLLFGKINVAFVKLMAHKLWAMLNITGYEKRNSLTNCQLLMITYLKAQHHFSSICWPLGVFFHVIQLEVLALLLLLLLLRIAIASFIAIANLLQREGPTKCHLQVWTLLINVA